MKKGYLKIAGTILAATLLFTGCAQTGSQSSVISGNDTKILMCMSDGNDTFRAMLADAAASTAQNLGAQFDLCLLYTSGMQLIILFFCKVCSFFIPVSKCT